jgi:hypothetical protein
MKARKVFLSLVGLVVFFTLTSESGCNDATDQDKTTTNKQMKIYLDGQPTPLYDYSPERDMFIQLYNYRMKVTRTWTVWRSDMGMIEGYAATIGYPIPYDVQLTNPLQQDGQVAIEQAEPNGLYSSKNTSATWIFEVSNVPGKGEMMTPVYIEGKVTCYSYPIDVDFEKNRVTRADTGKPSVQIALKTIQDLLKKK